MFDLPNTDVKKLRVTKQYADQKLSKIELPKLKVVSYSISANNSSKISLELESLGTLCCPPSLPFLESF